jgi:protease IV
MNTPEPQQPPEPGTGGAEPLSVTAAAALAEKRAAAAEPRRDGLEATVERLGTQLLAMQRSERRWRRFFRLAWLSLAVLLLALLLLPMGPSAPSTPHTAMVEVRGEIALDAEASAERLITSLRDAFQDSGAQAVMLRINSPGGSPVQSGLVNDEIRRLKALHGKKVYAVVEEICASGAYYIAAAADEIYVDKASLVGSIGVLMDGFGFTGAMDKLGIERRLLTAGSDKGMLDPFSPLDEKQRALAQQMLDGVHQQFITVVREGRGERLKAGDEAFSGRVWNGDEAVRLGLADALGSLEYVAREVVKAEDIVDYTLRDNVAERLAKRFGAGVGDGAVRALRAMGAMPVIR